MQYFTVRVDKILCLNYLGNKPVGWVILKCEKESMIYGTYKCVHENVGMMIQK